MLFKRDGDVILTFGASSFIQEILLDSFSKDCINSKRKDFRVIIVDSRPLLDGRKTLEVLTAAGISCSYTLLAGVGVVLKGATRVLLGASGVMSNGAVMAPIGTAMVASLAKAARIPVCFFTSTYYFEEYA